MLTLSMTNIYIPCRRLLRHHLQNKRPLYHPPSGISCQHLRSCPSTDQPCPARAVFAEPAAFNMGHLTRTRTQATHARTHPYTSVTVLKEEYSKVIIANKVPETVPNPLCSPMKTSTSVWEGWLLGLTFKFPGTTFLRSSWKPACPALMKM